MIRLLEECNIISNVIKIKEDQIIQINNIIYGVIYCKISSKFFFKKWKKRYFELTNTTLDVWNTEKSHKTCKRIKHIYNYNIESINNSELFGKRGLCIKIKNNKNMYFEFFSINEKDIKLFISKLNEFIIK